MYQEQPQNLLPKITTQASVAVPHSLFLDSRYFYVYIYTVYTVISVYVGPSVRMCVCMYVCMYTDPEYV